MGYTNSSLVSYTRISPNRTANRTHSIDTISFHVVVGQLSVETIGAIFANSSAEASSNYGVGYDGRIGMYVEEKDRSWCTSSRSNDMRAVTIEIASDAYHPYAVNDKAYNATIDLAVDICKRNNIKQLLWKADKTLIGQVDKQNVTAHRWFAAKACPGDYLYNKMGDLVAAVNKKLVSSSSTTIPSTTTPVNFKFDQGEIVNFLGGYHYISADSSSGTKVGASKAKITSRYNGKHPYHVRAVNDSGAYVAGVYGWVDTSTLAAIPASAGTLSYTVKYGDTLGEVAQKYGTTYQKLAAYNGIADPNRISVGQTIKIPQTASQISANKKSTTEIAKEVIKGLWGNGETRAQRLAAAGYDYDTIQAEVNRLLR